MEKPSRTAKWKKEKRQGDYRCGGRPKGCWVGGNPRYSGKGFQKSQRPKVRRFERSEINPVETKPAERYKLPMVMA